MAVGRNLAYSHAQRAGIPEDFFGRLIQQESGWNPNAVSPVGAFGLTQAMPASWSDPGFGVQPGGDRQDPNEQLRFGADYAGAMYQRYGGDPIRTAVAYNWGPGNADKWDGRMESLPEETRNYVQKVAMGGGEGDFPIGSNSLSTLADEEGPRGNSPVTLADLEDEYALQDGEVRINPGVGLQSLGAAIAAGSQGKSAAEDLARIRGMFNDEQEQEYQKRLAQMQREAAIQMVGADTEFGRALAEGADPQQVMSAWQQRQSFEQEEAMFGRRAEHDLTMQERGFTQDNEMFKKGVLKDWGLLDKRQEFEAGESDKDRDIQLQQMSEDTRQWEEEFQLKADALAEEAAITGNTGGAAKKLLADEYERAGMQTEAARIRQMPDTAFADPSMVSNFSDMIARGGDPTSKMQDFAYYMSLKAAGREEDAEKFWETQGGAKTEINLGAKGDVEAYKSDLGRADKLIDDQQISLDTLDALEAMDRTLQQNPTLTTGSIYDLASPVLNIARDLGMTTEDFGKDQTDRQMIDQINTYLATTIKTPGQISNYEQQSFKSATPGVSQPIDLLRDNVDRYIKLHERGLNRAEYIYGRIREELPDGTRPNFASASEEWKEMMNRGDPETRPILHNFDDYTTENLQAMGPVQPGQWIYVDGEMTPIVDQENADRFNSILFPQQ